MSLYFLSTEGLERLCDREIRATTQVSAESKLHSVVSQIEKSIDIHPGCDY